MATGKQRESGLFLASRISNSTNKHHSHIVAFTVVEVSLDVRRCGGFCVREVGSACAIFGESVIAAILRQVIYNNIMTQLQAQKERMSYDES